MLDVDMATKPIYNFGHTTTRIFRLCGLVLIVLMTMSCSGNRPLCPDIPVYPGATAIDFDEQDITRITRYTATASAAQILDYYMSSLTANEWVERVRRPDLINYDYYSDNRNPPFSMSIIIDHEANGIVEYRVALAISAPGASWRTHCTSLRP